MSPRELIWLGLSLFILASTSAKAAPISLAERFYGVYEGKAVSDADNEITTRDLRVEISGYKKGFSVTWIAVIQKSDDRVKRSEFSVNFQPSERSGIFRSAMRKNLFGQAVPLDPLKGHPYVWSTIKGDTLNVYALHISDSGGYEMQVYERTLVEGGLDLSYARVRDGEILRTVQGNLKRVK